MSRKIIAILIALLNILGCAAKEAKNQDARDKITVRAWHFPDIVHASCIAGKVHKTFERTLGKDVTIDWKIFNAGPSAIEALFANEIDIGYIGPNPAINGYIKSKGSALRIIAGASSAGAGLVIREDAGITNVNDFNGKKIATPQLGNTQDVACRAWLKKNGFKLTEQGGTVQVIPIENPDQLTLFIKKEIDAAWTKEPWVTRLIKEGKGKLFLDERDIWPEGKFVTAHIIVRTDFLEKHPDLVEKWIKAHIEATDWVNNHIEEAKSIVIEEVKNITGKELPRDVVDAAFSRTEITYDPIRTSLLTSAEWAYEAGLLGAEKPNLSGIYYLNILNKVLREMGRPEIK